ncbi:MAG: hypothetical protein WCG97_02840 [bacterium]
MVWLTRAVFTSVFIWLTLGLNPYCPNTLGIQKNMNTKQPARWEILEFLELALSGEIQGFLAICGLGDDIGKALLRRAQNHLKSVAHLYTALFGCITVLALISLWAVHRNHYPGYNYLLVIGSAFCLFMAVHTYEEKGDLSWADTVIGYWKKFRVTFTPSAQTLKNERLLQQKVHERLLELKWTSGFQMEDEDWRKADERFHYARMVAEERNLAADESEYDAATRGHLRTPSPFCMYIRLRGILEKPQAQPSEA